jgi:tetratricopeptide (TPR) repeat protein
LKDRLSARDQLYLDAWAARSGPPGPMLKKWQLLGQIYPDYYAAAYNYAYFAWNLENRAVDAIAAIQPALSEHDPLRAGAYYTLAVLLAAENQFDPAEKNFSAAAALGNPAQGTFHAAAYAAQRRFSEASKILEQTKSDSTPATDLIPLAARVAFDVDKGNWQHARDQLSDAAEKVTALGPFYSRIHRAQELSLDDYLVPKAKQIAELKAFIADARSAMEDIADTNHANNVFALLFGAYLAARADDYALAQTALTAATPKAHGSGFPNLEHLLAIVEAELSTRQGRPQDAIASLLPTVDGSELYLTHVALADAYTATGHNEDALKETAWLIAHRGRAYLEFNVLQILQARNVAESDLALLRSAELNAKLGKREAQEKALSDFLSTWPQAQQLPFVSPRLAALAKP